ncbi:helix-turn-helix domain-containing protein [Staphylococcus microti]|uniref:helix-turn-helix domain-containing protein n=1 Tax=Staphylococcus microti TaxID=569857 RepID=UPI0023E81AA3|nr:helix-turn-helix domain-containing protein [Staphylococcus microti]
MFFAKSFGCVRKVYNLMLHDRIKAYQEKRTIPLRKCVFQHLQNIKKNSPF